MGRFLRLVGFVSLLLGGLGVASGIHSHLRDKQASVAALRCLGATRRQTFLIYATQALGLGLVGATLGVLLGVAIQLSLPRLFRGMLPVEVGVSLSPSAMIQGLALGVVTTLLVSLLPLVNSRRVSALQAIRAAYEPSSAWRDWLAWAAGAALVVGIAAIAIWQAGRVNVGLGFAAGAAGAFAVLAGLGWGLMRLARKLLPSGAPYPLRQGVANLFRPGNRTVLLALSLGLGAFLLVTMQLIPRMLRDQIELTGEISGANLILFDIQADQRAGVNELLAAQGTPALVEAPVVTMRLAAVGDRTVAEIRNDRERRVRSWVLTREYRSSYRAEISPTERIVAGSWVSRVEPGAEVIPVSLEQGIANDLGVKVGDRLTFDALGMPLVCEVASIREVEWRRVSPNFFVVFPEGVLEEAPQFWMTSARTEGPEQAGAVQRALVSTFPNVSAVDLGMVLDTVERVVGRITMGLRFMALFTAAVGLLVLAAAAMASRGQRLREAALLRLMGASRRQLATIQLVEHAILGSIASATGLGLAWFASWALGKWLFELDAVPPISPLLYAWLAVTALTLLVGGLTGQRLLGRPALEALRSES
jgi:putative ABC transport system permease protein